MLLPLHLAHTAWAGPQSAQLGAASGSHFGHRIVRVPKPPSAKMATARAQAVASVPKILALAQHLHGPHREHAEILVKGPRQSDRDRTTDLTDSRAVDPSGGK